jgi:hypothetical protein
MFASKTLQQIMKLPRQQVRDPVSAPKLNCSNVLFNNSTGLFLSAHCIFIWLAGITSDMTLTSKPNLISYHLPLHLLFPGDFLHLPLESKYF